MKWTKVKSTVSISDIYLIKRLVTVSLLVKLTPESKKPFCTNSHHGFSYTPKGSNHHLI